MVATVCLRLAFGMIAPLVLLDPRPIPPRYFRVQFLVTLGLISVAAFFSYADLVAIQGGIEVHGAPKMAMYALNHAWQRICVFFIFSAATCLVGSIVWHLANAPGGWACICLGAVGLAGSLFFSVPFTLSEESPALNAWRIADNYASGAVLGTTTCAMLLGHSYLISPAMTISPLRRMLLAIAAALALRVTLACWGLYWWTAEHSIGNLDKETLLWLSARWLLGILAPLVLGWMAWETARIRSTQSATGILYVVVIVTFLGELTSLLLLEKTGYPL